MNDHDELEELDPTERDPGWFLLAVLAVIAVVVIAWVLVPYAGGK